jgi:hypothetical protein
MPFGLGFFATAGAGGAAGSFDLLETQVLTGNTASITFSSLSTYASTYQHLQLRYTARVTENIGGAGTFYLNVNSDTGSNYARHFLRGNGSSVVTASLTSTNAPDIGYTAGSESAANIFSAGVIDILDPFETTKYKTMRTSSGLVSGYKEVWLSSLLWQNTNALSSISLETYGSHSFVQYSRFSLYGIKAA